MSPRSSQTPVSDDASDGFDPFPEPRTFPGGWDLTGLASPARRPAAAPSWHTPFPMPRTIPEGWDLTDMLR